MATKSTTHKKSKDETPKKPIRPPRKTECSLRVNFTEKELLEIGKKLAEASQELSSAESEKKSVTSQLKARCESIESRIEQHANELSSGYTYRNVPCEVHYDTPKVGQKTTVRLDTNEIIAVDAMSMAEMQAELPPGEKPAAPAAGEPTTMSEAFDAAKAKKVGKKKAGEVVPMPGVRIDQESGVVGVAADEGRDSNGENDEDEKEE